MLRPKVRNQDENDNNQRHANASVANILSDRSEFNITNTRFSSSKSKLKR